MSITISGQNNNDKIVASDGVLDMLSGFNVVGVMTASSFDVGSNIKLGNAGIITATTIVGNVTGNLTGNVNSSSNLLLQIGGSEKFRVGSSGQLGIAGANYGTSGQVLTSGGSGSAATWSTITGTTINNNAANKVIMGSNTANTLEAVAKSSLFSQINHGQSFLDDNYLIFGDASDLQLVHQSSGAKARIRNTNDSGSLDIESTLTRFTNKDGSTEKLRIDSSGRLLVNTTTTYVSNQIMIVKGASPSGGGNRPYDGQLAIESTETSGAINTGGVLAFIGHDGNTSRGFGSIRNLKEDGTSGNYGTYMSFETRTNGSAPAEKLRIDSSGRVLIGTTTEGQSTADDLTIATSGSTGITIRSGTSNDGNIYFSDGTSGSDEFRGYIQYGHSTNDMILGTNSIERLRIRADGEIRINHTQTSTPLNNTFISIWDANSDSSAIDASGVSKNYAMISLHNYGTGVNGDTTGIGFGAGSGFSYTKGSVAFQRTGSYGTGDLVFLTNNDQDTTMVNDTDERMRISKEGYITKPNHPSFCARHNDSSTFSGNIIVLTRISNSWDVWNIGGHYSTSTGKFTAPVAGVYYFEGQLMTTGHSNGDNIQDMFSLESNRGRITYVRQRESYFSTSTNANGYYTNSLGSPAQLAAGDTVWLQRHSSQSWGYSNRYYSYFTGWLIG